MLTGPQQAIVNNIRSAKYIQQINNTCRLFPYTMHCLNDLTSVCPTILVKNLETLVCISSSPLLTWVLQSSQCSRIRVAQRWGRRGAHLSKCKKFFEKINSRETVSTSTICDEYCSYVPPLDRQLANLFCLPRGVAPFTKF